MVYLRASVRTGTLGSNIEIRRMTSMRHIIEACPTVADLRDAPVEDLAQLLLLTLTHPSVTRSFNDQNVIRGEKSVYGHDEDDAGQYISAAWHYLETERLVVMNASSGRGWFDLTDAGKKLADPALFQAHKRARRLPKNLLHPAVVESSWTDFQRGEYGTAVRNAMISVENRIREVDRKANGADGSVTAVRTAFNSKTGSLRNRKSKNEGEREGMSHLFAGAMAVYRNPLTHKGDALMDVDDGAHLLVFASHLHRVVERRLEEKPRKKK